MSNFYTKDTVKVYGKNYVARPAAFIVKRGVIMAVRSSAYGLKKGSLIPGMGDDFTADAKVISYLNTPVYSNLILGIGDNKDTSYVDIEGNELTFKGLEIDTVLMEINMSKTIIKTSISGRNGTIKEYINDGDYIINIQGRFSLKTLTYPESSVNRLIKICQVPDAIPVTSDFLTMYGINEMVIEDFKLPQERGLRNEQSFELTCISEQPIILEYVET
jgi:hypothetical protein